VMRMWMVPPSHMCSQHLLGEHSECHGIVGALNLGMWNYQGVWTAQFDDKIDPTLVHARHDALVEEMLLRGMKHQSPLKPYAEGVGVPQGHIDFTASYRLLMTRCAYCAQRAMKEMGVDGPTEEA